MSTTVSPAEAGIEVGDFFYASWGYDQTNITWFKVVGLTPKGVKVQEWQGKTLTDEGGTYDSVVPGDKPATDWDWGHVDFNDFDAPRKPVAVDKPIQTKRLQSWGHDANSGRVEVHLYWTSFANLRRWDGTAKYQTGAGWGH